MWLYLRFTLSYRDVEDLLAARGLDVSYETIRRWVLKLVRRSREICVTRGPNLTTAGTSMKWSC